MAITYKAAAPLFWAGQFYNTGDVINTTGWTQNAVTLLLHHAPVYADQGEVAGSTSVDSSGMTVVTHSDVQNALADIDAWAKGHALSTLLELPDGTTYEQTDPAVIPFFQTSFTASSTTHLVDVDVVARAIGYGTASLWLAWCDSTVGRRPYPKTQAEFLSAPAGISYLGVGCINPSMETNDLTAPPNGSGIATRAGRMIRLSGLTVGHTYYLDLCASIQGNGAQTYSTALNLNKMAVVPTSSGILKVYLGKFPVASGVSIVSFSGLRPLASPVLSGTTIADAAGEHVNAMGVTPDYTRMIFGAYSTTTTGNIYIVNTSTDAITFTTALGDIPTFIAPSPDSTKAWIGKTTGATIQPITVSTGVLGTAVATGTGPIAGQVSPDGTKLWVLCQGSKDLRSHQTSDGSATGTPIAIPTMSGTPSPQSMCINNEGTRIYVADSGTGYLHEIDIATRTVLRSLNIGVKTWYRCLVYPGTTTQTVQVFGSGGAGPQGIRQVNVTDWQIYVDWTANNQVDAWLGPRGEIISLDTTSAAVRYWPGCRFALKRTFPGGAPDFAWGEHAQLLVTNTT